MRLIIILVVVLAGCETAPKLPERTMLAVSTPCIDRNEIPPRPDLFTDEQMLALDRYKRTLKMWEERREREKYEKKLAGTLEACAR